MLGPEPSLLATARGGLRIVDPRVRKRFFWGLGPSVLVGVVEAAGVALVLPFVQSVGSTTGGSGSAVAARLVRFVGVDARGSTLVWIGVGALGLLILRTIASAVLIAWQLRVIAWSEGELTRRVLHTYLVQPWSFHQTRDVADLSRNVRFSVWQVHNQVLTPVFTLPGELAVAASIVAVLVLLNPLVAGALGVFFGVVAVTAGFLGGRRAARAGADAMDFARELDRRVHDGLRAAKSLGVHGGGEVVASRLDETLPANERSRYHMALAQYLPRYLLEATLAIGLGGLALLLTSVSNADPVPTLALFATGGVRVVGPLSRLLTASSAIRSGAKALAPIERDLDLPLPAATPAPRRREPGPPPDVELRAVSYLYPDARRPALAHVDLRIGAGELVAITGPSGAGKTTLIDVILGLLPPASGSVVIDGVPMSDQDPASWLDRLGYVPQDAVVLDDTVARNVALGVADHQIDPAAVAVALRDAELLPTVEALPNGLSEALGDRDGRLSGGERQRLAIARALYRNAAMLVLDEPTSSLDLASEALFLDTIRGLRGQHTVLLVTHRRTAAERCDRIVVLDRGRVVDDDSATRHPSVASQA